MKFSETIAAILLLQLVSSCSTYYYVVTDVDKDVSVKRSVYAESSDDGSATVFLSPSVWIESSVNEPFEVDFYDQTCTMGKVYDSDADIISVLSFQPDSDQKDNPLFKPDEKLDKKFKWFYTYYVYSAVFKSLKERLPLPMDAYLTPQQKTLFFKGQNPPQGWNGIEIYYLLDDVNSKFAEWYSDVVFYVLSDMIRQCCSTYQLSILDDCKESFMKDLDRELIFVMEPDDFTARLSEIYPDAGFEKIYDDNEGMLKAAYEKEAVMISYFGYSFIYTIRMPGKFYDGNAVDFIDGNPSWKIDGFRLMDGDLVLDAVSRKLNLWAFAVTFVLIILLLQVFAKVFAKR